MAKWEYNVVISDVSPGGLAQRPNLNAMWDVPRVGGQTDVNRVQQLGGEGWELVNVIPIAGTGGFTLMIMWVFKRQIA